MSQIAALNLSTGHAGVHRWHYAQVRNSVIMTNGHDKNRVYSVLTGISQEAGITAPGAGTTATAGAAGLPNGTYTYRIRYRDEKTNTMSLPSAAVSCSPVNQQVTIDITALAPPTRATHWIVERILDGESIYFPVNRTASTPDGTAIATKTFVDNVSDDTLGQRKSIRENQSKISPYRVCFSNLVRVFYVGRRVHQATCTLVSGANTVSSADGKFTEDMAGQYLTKSTQTTTGKAYKIATYVNANNLTLEENYTANETVLCNIAGPGDRECWSEAGEPEHGGGAEVGLLENEMQVGGGGDVLVGGVGLGPMGVLLAGENTLFLHSYKVNPRVRPFGDGEVTQLPTKRGIVGPLAIRNIGGIVYGIDANGIWRLTPGSTPDPLSGAIANEWKNANLNLSKGDNWHIGWDPTRCWIYFFVCEGTDTYPKKAYIFDELTNTFIGTRTYPLGVTCTIELPDSNGAVRMCYYTEISGAAKSYCWMSGIGNAQGLDTSLHSPLSGTIASGTSTTFTVTGGSFSTSGEGLKGVPVTKITAAGVEETRIISSNTATTPTVSSAWSTTPVAGDTYRLGPIDAIYRTGRITAGETIYKKRFKRLFIWTKYLLSSVTIKVRQYLDGRATAYSDRDARSEDGLSVTADKPDVTIDPAHYSAVPSTDANTGRHVFEIPLNNEWAKDCQIEVRSNDAGVPWHILAMRLEGEYEDAVTPTEK